VYPVHAAHDQITGAAGGADRNIKHGVLHVITSASSLYRPKKQLIRNQLKVKERGG
jgi:hypothetical protein